MSVIHSWFTNQELPGFRLSLTLDGTRVDLSSGYTGTVEIVRANSTTLVVTESTNISLVDGVGESYNFAMTQWSAATLSAIATDLTTQGVTSARYELRPKARVTSGSADEYLTSHSPIYGTFKTPAA